MRNPSISLCYQIHVSIIRGEEYFLSFISNFKYSCYEASITVDTYIGVLYFIFVFRYIRSLIVRCSLVSFIISPYKMWLSYSTRVGMLNLHTQLCLSYVMIDLLKSGSFSSTYTRVMNWVST